MQQTAAVTSGRDWSLINGRMENEMALTPAQLEHLEKRLHEERARLLEQLHGFEETTSPESMQDSSGDLSKYPTHPADLGTDVSNEDIELSIGSRVSQELGEIDAALARIATTPETFGMDEQSGEPIPFERLDIIPYARVGVDQKPSTERGAEASTLEL